jgi:cytochrome b pre-mRNA-processing protein 3
VVPLAQALAICNADKLFIPGENRSFSSKTADMIARMRSWLQERRKRLQTARELYGSIVTRARNPQFYAQWGVPDSREGRFEMLVLHVALVLRRLAQEGPAGQRLGRALAEVFVIDMDDSMREMSVGDMAVPRSIKRAVAALHDRQADYTAALATGADLTAVLHRHLDPFKGTEHMDAAALSTYIAGAAQALGAQAGAEVLAGRILWPPLSALAGSRGRSHV